MLVLTRKVNQSIMIGNEIEVSVISVVGDKVRLGIQAPRDVAVFRREVFDEIQAQNAAAAEASLAGVDDVMGALGASPAAASSDEASPTGEPKAA